MQGIQSSLTPDQYPEPRPEERLSQSGLTPAPSGPLDAAKRYLDRQRANRATLAAMDEEESSGRPAWLRRWPSEVRREIATERWISSRPTPPNVPAESLRSVSDASPVEEKTETSGSYKNGYNGQSIEAAFAFETVYHFDTEFEAEATEDWLDLSSGGSKSAPQSSEPGLSAKDSSEANINQSDDSDGNEQSGGEAASETLKPEIELRNELRVELGPKAGPTSVQRSGQKSAASFEDELFTPSSSSPDPQAVRAAIFRLAQESPIGRNGIRSSELPTKEVAFAEVARRVWGDTGEARGAAVEDMAFEGSVYENGLVSFSDLERRQAVGESAELGSPIANGEANALGLAVGLAVDQAARLSEASELAQAETARVTALEVHAANVTTGILPIQTAFSNTEAHAAGIGTVLQPATETGAYAFTEERRQSPTPPIEIADSVEALPVFTESVGAVSSNSATQAADQAVAQAAFSRSNNVPPTEEELHPNAGKASEAPALAHDAGNLLSALKLYSELLALSGVLHARHKHYAQDLKLLAARSEVLIDRLLISCSVAESHTRSLLNGRDQASLTPANRDAVVTSELDAGFRQAIVAEPPVPSGHTIAAQTAARISSDVYASKGGPAGQRDRDHEASSFQTGSLEQQGLPAELPNVDEVRSGKEEAAPINLVDLLTRWGSLLSMIAHGSVQVNFGPNSALPIRVAEEAMERILVNLVHNAMTATRGGGTIRIGVGRAEKRPSVLSTPSNGTRAQSNSQSGDRMVLTVDDSGCGMTEEQIDQALGKTRTAYENDSAAAATHSRRGMGLQIVRGLVAASGGQLTIYSRRGVGTRIEMDWLAVRDATAFERIPPISVGVHGEALPQAVAPTGQYSLSSCPVRPGCRSHYPGSGRSDRMLKTRGFGERDEAHARTEVRGSESQHATARASGPEWEHLRPLSNTIAGDADNSHDLVEEIGADSIDRDVADLQLEESQDSWGGSTEFGIHHLLVVDDDDFLRNACCEIARKMGFTVHSAESVPAARAVLKVQPVDLLLLDLKLPGGGGLLLLEETRALHPETVVVVMTAFATVSSAVEAMRIGAADYLTKPFALEELRTTLTRAAQRRQYDMESRLLREKLRSQNGDGHIIGNSPEMEKLYRILSKVAFTTHPVLILGESGTGKEMVARTIHFNGPNARKPFVPVDCSSLAPTLIESELFGHVKGAFTGAHRSKEGLLATAEGGTVFLDEIGELPLDLQAKLLRALQEKEVRPVGANHAVPISARVLAATNCNLLEMVEQGKFRKDLYFRLNVVNLRIPALRDRREDIPVLAQHFLDRMQRETGRQHMFSDEALRLMAEFSWPGNVRELENAIERACALSSGPLLHMGDLPTQLQDFRLQIHQHLIEERQQQALALQAGANGSATGIANGANSSGNGSTYASASAGRYPGNTDTSLTQLEAGEQIVSIAELEKQAILNTIRQLNGDKLMAAKLLQIGKTTLYRKLKEYGIAEGVH